MDPPEKDPLMGDDANAASYGVDDDPYKGKGINGELLGICSQNVRQGFIRKVYGILLLQILVTTAGISLFVFSGNVKSYVVANPWTFYLAISINLVTILSLACCAENARTYPKNMIFLSLFTLSEAFLVGCISATYETDTVMIAFGMTACVVLGLTCFAFQTKYDFTGMGPYLFAALLSLIIFGFFAAIFRSRAGEMAYAGLGVLIFSLYLVYDTQLVIGGEHKKFQFSVDDYVFAALNLYLDIINLFLMILSLLGDR